MSVGFDRLRVMLVGPVPPPHGGMANQTLQLADLLRSEGATVELVEVNAPYSPRWVGRIPVLRAGFRLLPFLARLWRAAGRADIVHVMASSGWSWHLAAAPAVWIGRRRRVAVVLNYRGGGAAEFFRRSMTWVRPTLERCSVLVVPSPFLERVFRGYGFSAAVVPNIVDLRRFTPAESAARPSERPGEGPHLIVARNLEPVYDIGTALRAFGIIRKHMEGARMSIAGSGVARGELEALAAELDLEDSVAFTGRLENPQMANLYRNADLVLNPSLVDNMPISILEALASGVPVVSTNVGGIPDLVGDVGAAKLVAPRDPEAMANAALQLLTDSALRSSQVQAGLKHVRRFTWEEVRGGLLGAYARAVREGVGPGRGAS